ncbi:hypothetical protein MKX01_010195 [Papaver californicum]|nr:hypothetical protein MKX01_010195 [Papaver californicum]
MSTNVFSFLRDENPQVFAWAIVYASGCVATLPLLCWRFWHRNQGTVQDSSQARQDATKNNPPPESSPFGAISVLRGTDEEDHQTAVSSARNAQSVRISARVNLCLCGSHFFFWHGLLLAVSGYLCMGSTILQLRHPTCTGFACFFLRFAVLDTPGYMQ